MIQIEKVDVWGFEHAVRGCRNPYNSWSKSDSHWDYVPSEDEGIDSKCVYVVGEADLDLMKRLYKAGSEHRKYLRQIFVSMDVNAPRYWWEQQSTYKIGTTSNSCSTMHTIHKKKFELDDFSHDHLGYTSMSMLIDIVHDLNLLRGKYLDTKDKEYWYSMIQLLPQSYMQKRTITMNYENVVSIIKQRSGHKLTEWNDFVAFLEGLPYVKEIMEG